MFNVLDYFYILLFGKKVKTSEEASSQKKEIKKKDRKRNKGKNKKNVKGKKERNIIRMKTSEEKKNQRRR